MKQNKMIIVALILVVLLLLFNMVYEIMEYIDYGKRVRSGNNKWLQVENRIVTIEEELNNLEIEVEKWKK